MSCPCGVGPSLSLCCGRFLAGQGYAATAEELMRSRYTAFHEGDIAYLERTHHESTRTLVDHRETERWAKRRRWTGLEIVEVREGGPGDAQGWVEFKAHFSAPTGDGHVHERSYFERDAQGRWSYLSGEVPKPAQVVREQPKVPRNDPCPCGSGKKFKKCCLA